MQDHIRNALAIYREILEEHVILFLSRHNPDRLNGDLPLTTDFCKGSSAALRHVLDDAFPEYEWVLAGGIAENGWILEHEGIVATAPPDHLFPGGMMDVDGEWKPHFWIEGRGADGSGLIVDVTADQFGYEEVLVTDVADPRYRRNSPREFGYREILTDREKAFGLDLFIDWKREAYQGPTKKYFYDLSP